MIYGIAQGPFLLKDSQSNKPAYCIVILVSLDLDSSIRRNSPVLVPITRSNRS